MHERYRRGGSLRVFDEEVGYAEGAKTGGSKGVAPAEYLFSTVVALFRLGVGEPLDLLLVNVYNLIFGYAGRGVDQFFGTTILRQSGIEYLYH